MTFSPTTSRVASPPPDISRAIMAAAVRTGTSFEYLVDQARLESGFRPDAKAATSSAQGLYQFTTGTWLSTVKAHGAKHGLGWAADAISESGKVADPARRSAILALRNDPALAAMMAAEHAGENRATLLGGTGRAPEDVDLYLAHFLGAAGAVRFLNGWQSAPETPAAPLFPEAASANRAIFFDSEGRARSLDQIRRNFAAKLDSAAAPSGLPNTRQMAVTRRLTSPSLEMQAIQPMPKSLSLDFAMQAYHRIASGGGA